MFIVQNFCVQKKINMQSALKEKFTYYTTLTTQTAFHLLKNGTKAPLSKMKRKNLYLHKCVQICVHNTQLPFSLQKYLPMCLHFEGIQILQLKVFYGLTFLGLFYSLSRVMQGQMKEPTS